MGQNANLTPRQKMINLMYIVLTAMLALNVSSDVLNGFKQVEDGLVRSTRQSSAQNQTLYSEIAAFYQKNPEKSKEWYLKAMEVKKQTDSLYTYVDDLKLRIAQQADGKDADITNIKRKDDLEAASYIMLSPTQQQGKQLKYEIENYRTNITSMLPDSNSRKAIEEYLALRVPKEAAQDGKNWQEAMFENMPVSAAITILSKLQNDLRYTEGEVLHNLIKNVDLSDVRVNKLNAYVIPNSRNVIRGSKYSANIVLAAIDSTQQPTIFIGSNELPAANKGLYEVVCGKSGVYDFKGHLEVLRGDGTTARFDFNSSYTVIDPTATVSATLMNVLYAGINNPISISVPGVPPNAIQATMSNGTLTRSGNDWMARPAKVGTESTITVTANVDGRSQVVSTTQFRVRQLPDPMPFITYRDDNGAAKRYRGGQPFPKNRLLEASGIEAAIDDNLLNVTYRVIRFETIFFDSMGNAIPEVAQGTNFSDRQKNYIRNLSKGKRFYITHVVAKGPDGIERTIPTIEVIVN